MITAANASQLAVRSHEQRRINKERRLLQPPEPQQLDHYVLDQLIRTREHIKRLHGLIDQETDPQQIERLWRALNLASERERVLAGRPLPGNLRPERTVRRAKITSMVVLPAGMSDQTRTMP